MKSEPMHIVINVNNSSKGRIKANSTSATPVCLGMTGFMVFIRLMFIAPRQEPAGRRYPQAGQIQHRDC